MLGRDIRCQQLVTGNHCHIILNVTTLSLGFAGVIIFGYNNEQDGTNNWKMEEKYFFLLFNFKRIKMFTRAGNRTNQKLKKYNVTT